MDDEPELLDGLARFLAERGLVTYTSGGGEGEDCFLEDMPSSPDEAVALTIYDDRVEPDSLLPYDEPRVQLRVRGTTDPRVSRRRCARIRSELHGLGSVTLPDGTELILSVCIQGAPASIGVDESRRHEHVANFRMEIRNPTTHRV
ncbi:minor capsid protein [Streptomyces sp. P9(2023)]|uniref:minor capsid protein n=1 Tax=Streptomyces sp. P9(2023) TaxID=3064394 RepID=UPI0028F42DE0|nr:minor capsid protein [Streptomyces sp. P9(2023)]MDT9688196.1 minor capsid protein [Streptomyces sp. P9(2023)]